MFRSFRAAGSIIRVRMAATSERLMGSLGLKQWATPFTVLPSTTPAR